MNEDFLNKLIEHFKLKPLPFEGGLFLQTYKSYEQINISALPKRYLSSKSFSTAILYLLTNDPDCFSAIHMLKSDEIYHFYLGDPIEMLILYSDGTFNQIILGSNILEGEFVQYTIPKNSWHGSRLIHGGQFALIGTTMAPGYDDDDFILGNRAMLCQAYPNAKTFIYQLTRQ